MIDTYAVKNKILDFAMRGQLTKQLPEDGTAEALYAQVFAEKARLIKEGKLKKEKLLGEISGDDTPFKIPENWKWVSLKDVCTKIVDGDHNPPAGVHEKTEYLMLSAQNINNDRIVNIENARYLSREVFIEEDKRTRLEIGDVLLTIVATLGRSCVYREKFNVCFQRSVCVISPLINPDFLKRYLDCDYIQKLMVDNATGAAQPGFYLNKVERICVPLPPANEQERIVERIEDIIAVLNKIDALQEQYSSNQEALKSKIIDTAIQGKLTEQLSEDGTAADLLLKLSEGRTELVNQGEIRKKKVLPALSQTEYPFDIPHNWEWAHVSDVWAIINGDRGKNYPAKSTLSHTGIPFISALNLDGATVVADEKLLCLSDEQFEKLGSGKLKKGDVVVCIRGSLGKHGKYPFEKGAIASSLIIARNYLRNEVINDYLMIYLDSQLFRDEIEKYNGGSAQPNLAAESLEKFRIPLPPVEEQEKIVNRVSELLVTIAE